MLMDCTCGTNIEAKLNEVLDKVFCMECNEEVEVSSFTKTMMKQRRDIISRAEAKIPPNGLKATCDNAQCNKDFSAEVDKKKDKVFCPHCKSEAKISTVAIRLLKEHKIFVGMTDRFLTEEGKDSDQFLQDVESEVAPDKSEESESANKSGKPVAKKAKKTAGRGRPKGSKNKTVVKVGPNKDGSLPTAEDLKAVRDQLGSKDTDN